LILLYLQLKKIIKTYLYIFLFVILFSLQVSAKNRNNTYFEITSNFQNQKSIAEIEQLYKTYLVQFSSEKKIIQVFYLATLANRIAQEKQTSNSESYEYFQQALKIAKSEKNEGLLLWLNTQFGFYQYTYFNYVCALTYFLESSRSLENINSNQIIDIEDVLMKNAYFFYSIKDYQISINYLNKALKVTAKESENYPNFLNALGNCYYDLGNTEKALSYFKLTQKSAEKINDTLRYAKALGDIAKVYINKNKINQAESFLLEDISLSKKVGNQRNTMFAQLRLANLYLEKNELDKAKKVLNEVFDFVTQTPTLNTYYYEASISLLQIFIKEKNNNQELILRRRIDSLRPIIEKSIGIQALNEINWKTQKERIKWEIEAENIKIQKEILLKTTFIIISCLLFLLVILLIVLAKRKIKIQRIKFKNSLLIAEISQINSEKALKEANKSLKYFKTFLLEKNKEIIKLENDLKILKNTDQSDIGGEQIKLEHLLTTHLLTNENWNTFKNAFNNEEPQFLAQIQVNFPDLTESNLRTILLTRIGLTNQEIANALGITIPAVKKAKQRMRNKYGTLIEGFI